MNPIRIAHVLPFATIGGTEKATLRLAEAAAQSGFENVIYCPTGAGDLKRLFQDHGFRTRSYEQVEPSYRRPRPYLRASKALAADLRQNRVQIMHCADILGAHYAALAGRFAGAYVISHVRCQHSQISVRDRTFLRPVERWVFVSQDTWSVFGLRVPPHKGEVLYEGLDASDAAAILPKADARAHFGIAPDAAVIGMAARVHPNKDFETLIHAAEILKRSAPRCVFLIAGDYEQEPAHREYFERLQPILQQTGTAGLFRFAGFQRELATFFAALDVFVLATHGEGFPLVIVEAMNAERPVIATDAGGVREAILDGETGLLVPLRSPEVLAQSLNRLLSDEQERTRLARNGYAYVRGRLSGERFRKQVRNLYCTAAKQRGWVGDCSACIST